MHRSSPDAIPDHAGVAAVLADPSRAAMCSAMLDGCAWTVGELGQYCRLERSTTTSHLEQLIAAGIVIDVQQGRHRYLRLANEDMAILLGQLGVVAEPAVPTPRSLNAARVNHQLRTGRTCYQHLAGRLGVGLTDRLLRRELLGDDRQLTEQGYAIFSEWGMPAPNRLTAAPCLDFTERRSHLAGRLGTALATTLFGNGWLERAGDTRAVRLTPAGHQVLTAAGLIATP